MRDNASGLTPDGLSVLQTYQLVTERTQRLVASQYDMLQNVIFPALEQEGVFFTDGTPGPTISADGRATSSRASWTRC